MALVVADRVQETTSTTSTSDYVLLGAAAGYQSFGAVLANADTTYYAITNDTDWEVGIGTYSTTGPTLARTTILASSNAGSAVIWGVGVKNIFISYAASKSVYLDASGNLSVADKIIHTGDTNTAIRFPAADTVSIETGGTERFKVENSTITSTVPVLLPADPTLPLQAATKEYVDTIASASIHYHAPVRVESPTPLTASYNNGTSGVGATLTNSGTQAALVIDGVAVSVNDRVLVYTQTNQTQNGVYDVTNIGSVSTNWILTRSADADSYGPSDPTALGAGDAFFVSQGNTGAGELYVCNTPGTITFGTTNITFVQISATTVYTAGTGISLTNNVITNTAPDQVVALTQGGATTITGTYPNFTISSTDTVYTAGGGIGLAGTTFSVAAGTGLTQDADGLSHADTSSQASVDNTGATFVQDVNLDGFGHVTGLASVTVTPSLIGAPSTSGVGATGTWGISVTGTASNVTGTVAVANGGTGATTAGQALDNLSAAPRASPALTGNVTVTSNSASPAVTITQTGTGAAILVEDSTSPDSTPFIVDASGNVGIGTASPSSTQGTALHVYNNQNTGTVASNAAVIVESVNRNVNLQARVPTTGTASFLTYNNDGTTLYGGMSVIGNSGSPNTLFFAGASERMRILAGGNVGIGTIAPVYTLEAAGVTKSIAATGTGNPQFLAISSDAAGIPFMTLQNATSSWQNRNNGTTGDLSWSVSGSERMRITLGGNLIVGNGDTSATPISSTLRTTNGSGTDIAGASLTVQGGRGTGTGAGGALLFSTAAAGTTGSALNAATERMRIDSAGNVGIGTTSPGEKLVVEGASPFILVNNTDETRSGVRFADVQNIGERFQLAYDAGTAAMCFDRVESTGVITERMRIDASGNVGIGVSSPSAKLDVTGISGAIKVASGGIGGYYGIKYDPASAGSRSWAIYSDYNALGDFNILTSATQTGATSVSRFYIDASGNVGIGTNAPATKLAVSGGALRIDAGDAIEDALVIGAGTSGTTGEFRSVKIFANSSTVKGIQLRAENAVQRIVSLNGGGIGQLAFGNSSDGGTTFNERMRIDASGNVGIGTSSTSARLEVLGNAVNTMSNAGTEDAATLAVTNSDSSGLGRIAKTLYEIANLPIASVSGVYTVFNGSNDIGGALAFSTQTNAAGGVVERMRIDASGNVGIGTSGPNTRLSIDGALNFTAAVTTPAVSASIFTPLTSNLAFGTASEERMRINASGNVGIGTTSPTALLQVDGGEIRQFQYANSTNYLTYAASGTQDTPTAISVATTLAINSARAYDGTTYRDVTSIRSGSDGAITSTSSPGYLTFRTTPSGSVATVERLRIASAGAIGIDGANYGTSGQTIVSAGSAAAPAWGYPAQLSTASGTAPSYACRAWVNFNGTGTVAIRASGNVTSITDGGTGFYTVNFTTAMPDANYSAVVTGTSADTTSNQAIGIAPATAPTSGAVKFLNESSGGTNQDAAYVMVAIFR